MEHMVRILGIGMIVCLIAMVVPVAALNEGKILFPSETEGNWDIYVINPDGTNRVRLLSTPVNEWSPAWSPDGSRIVFESGGHGSLYDLYTMNADGTDVVRLTFTEEDEMGPSWSPDGGMIIFCTNRDGDPDNYEIYTMNADGTNQTRLTNTPEFSDIDCSWSPNGEKILFSSGGGDNNFDLYTMNTDGTNVVRLTDNPTSDDMASWSPDGSKIVFESAEPGDCEIYTMNADGTNQTPLTSDPARDYEPGWSPDGSKIVFVSTRDGNQELYTMNADGTNQTRLTDTPLNYEAKASWKYGSSITVTGPNGGETFYHGSPLLMNWSYQGYPGAKVDIAVLKGDTVLKVLAGIPIGSSGSGSYNVPIIPPSTPPGNNYKIQITSASSLAYTDRSDATFTISGPTITVTVPDGGETFYLGSSLPMNWTYHGDPGPKVDIAVLKGGSTLKTIPGIPIGTGGSGSYSVLIPAITPLGSDYTIKVTSSSIPACNDTSNSSFAIGVDPGSSITVVSPNGGEKWTQGSNQTISWTYTGSPGSTVTIEALLGETVLATVASGYPIGSGGIGTYNLTFPFNTPVGSEYWFRVTSTSIPAYTDTSDSAFSILPAITVDTPNGGENYALNSTLTMNWTFSGNPGSTVTIEVFKGVTLLKTLTGIPIGTGGSGSLPVTIPPTTPVGPDYTIRVTSTSYPACRDTSDAAFSIGAMAATFQGALIDVQSLAGGGYFVVNITTVLDDAGGVLHPGDQVTITYASGLPPEYQQDYEIDPDLEAGDSVEVFCTIFGTSFVLRDGNYVRGLSA
ncbi:MAG: translocation protein TolB [Euryarchaeota archaeon ADurb.BinA087]|nr:MAG: translocation protein TolB [Euryarchaeota archaeon ADurb.BinA087]